MIENFKHRGLKKLYEKGDRSSLRTDIAEKAELYLSILDTAQTVQELDITGFGIGSLATYVAFTVWLSHEITGSFFGLKMATPLMWI